MSLRGTAILAIALFIAAPALAEIPRLSREKLQSKASEIVVGKVQDVYSTSTKGTRFEDSKHIAQIRVEEVEKGDRIKPGDIIYAHYWRRRLLEGRKPEPFGSGHEGVSNDEEIRAYLSFHEGVYKVMLPNGFEKLDAKDEDQ